VVIVPFYGHGLLIGPVFSRIGSGSSTFQAGLHLVPWRKRSCRRVPVTVKKIRKGLLATVGYLNLLAERPLDWNEGSNQNPASDRFTGRNTHMGTPTTIKVEPFLEKYWLQVSYVMDALGYAKTDQDEILPPGTIGKFQTSEKDGLLTFNVIIPKHFPSSWLRSIGIERPDCSLRSGQEESGDSEHHVLKLSIDQFPSNMREHLDFFSTVENTIGVVDAVPDAGVESRAFLGYGLFSAIVKAEDYVFRIPADISVRPFAAFIGLDRTKIVREAVVDEAGEAVCDQRGIPLHSFAVPIATVRRHFAAQTVAGQKTVTFTLPKSSAGLGKALQSGSDTTLTGR
jgi:hypothetical protein